MPQNELHIRNRGRDLESELKEITDNWDDLSVGLAVSSILDERFRRQDAKNRLRWLVAFTKMMLKWIERCK